MNVTIKEIAEFADVSIGTVSKVLNNKGNVKPKLRLRVLAVVEKMKYRPSAIARSFKNKGTRMIGLIVPRILSQFYIKYVHTTERFLKSRNYHLLLGNTDEDIESEIEYIRTFADMRVAGLVISTSSERSDQRIMQELEAYQTLKIPIVNVSRKIGSMVFDTVVLDYNGGAYTAAKYLLENGHRRIAIISSPAYSSVGMEFHEGYIKALYDFRVPYDKDLICFGKRNVETDYRNIMSLLSLPRHPPTAIIVSTNFRLISVLRALKEKGMEIPKDVSLISFGDEEFLPYINPPLTAITTSPEKMSETAIKMLFERIEGTISTLPRSRCVKTRLVERQSVKSLMD